MIIFRLFVVALLWMVAVPTHASDTAANSPLLQLSDVLASSRVHAPKLLEQRAALRGAGGDVIAAEGAFDTQLNAEVRSRATGTWSGSYIKADVKRNLTDDGISVYGGYRLSDGRFPIYEDQYFTNTLGEFKLGVLVPLLQDRAFDKNRFGVADAQLKREAARIKILVGALEVQRDATLAYWDWVVSGQQLAIYQDLLAIARQRDSALTRQVEEGAVADIAVLENLQNITRRETLVMNARQKFMLAANKLSLYLRTGAGTPQRPTDAQLPDIGDIFAGIGAAPSLVGPKQAVVAQRPEIETLGLSLERARQKLRLGENSLKPQLALMGEVSRDFGSVAEGGSSRDSTDAVMGVRFSIPLGQRAARGSITRAKADMDRLTFQRQQLIEQFTVELENVTLGVEMALRRLDLTAQNVEQTKAMQRAEQTRFENGASDFFLLNVREEAAANAEIAHLLAALDFHAAMANYAAATMDFSALGMEEEAIEAGR